MCKGGRICGWLAGLIIGSHAMAGAGLAQQPYVYPEKGQSPQQQQRDQAECDSWAVQQSRFDPRNPQVAVPPPPGPQAPQGGVVRGGARGAAVGAVGGAIGGDAGKGAAAGAAAGALVGGMRRVDQRRAAEQQQSAASAEYGRAYQACLEGRGYTVK